MIVSFTKFAFTVPAGGTGLSNWKHNARYPHPTVKVKVVKGWHDYECGYRFIAESACPELTAYLEANGSKEDRRVFVSEFDLVDRRDLGPLIDAVVPDEEEGD